MPPVKRVRLLRIPEPFDSPDFVFEPKRDGFLALAHVRGHHCDLVSRNGHTFKSWLQLAEEIPHAVRAYSCVLDGDFSAGTLTAAPTSRICCSAASGCTSVRSMCFASTVMIYNGVAYERGLEGIVASARTAGGTDGRRSW